MSFGKKNRKNRGSPKWDSQFLLAFPSENFKWLTVHNCKSTFILTVSRICFGKQIETSLIFFPVPIRGFPIMSYYKYPPWGSKILAFWMFITSKNEHMNLDQFSHFLVKVIIIQSLAIWVLNIETTWRDTSVVHMKNFLIINRVQNRTFY